MMTLLTWKRLAIAVHKAGKLSSHKAALLIDHLSREGGRATARYGSGLAVDFQPLRSRARRSSQRQVQCGYRSGKVQVGHRKGLP